MTAIAHGLYMHGKRKRAKRAANVVKRLPNTGQFRVRWRRDDAAIWWVPVLWPGQIDLSLWQADPGDEWTCRTEPLTWEALFDAVAAIHPRST